jgi:ribonuclease J
MNICIHRGSNQIGGNCVELESNNQRLIFDIGLPLDALENTSEYLPPIKGLDGSDPSLLAILITHPHLDHYGLLAHVSSDIPVALGSASRRILKAAAPFVPNGFFPQNGIDLISNKQFDLGPFKIIPYLLDHSAYDSYGLLIECEGKRLFYTGDFRAHGRKARLFDMFIHNPPKDVDTLLMEGTTLGRLDSEFVARSENEIEDRFVELFQATSGLVLVHPSIQNIDRMVSIFRACKRSGRRMVIDLYAAVILEATGNPNIPQSNWPNVAIYIPQRQRVQIKNNKWFDLLKSHSRNRIFIEDLKEVSGKSTLLFRSLHCMDLEKADCLENAIYIFSMWEGYQEKENQMKVRNWLTKHSIPEYSVHTSGHASIPDLKKLVEALEPGHVVPIHTAFPEQFKTLFPRVELHSDNEWWKI